MKTVKIGSLTLNEKPVLLCTVLEKTPNETIKQAKAAMLAGADAIELRIDNLADKSMIGETIRKINYPHLVVCRPTELDGFFKGTESERVEWLLEALDYNPNAIDIEYTTTPVMRQKVIDKAKAHNVPMLICYENFEKTPSKEELLKILKEEEKLGADIAKFAVIAKSYEDTITVIQTVVEAKKILNIPYVAIAMGNFGSMSRPYALKLGAAMTYCAVEKGKEGAPGQLTVADTRKILEILS